MPPRPRVKVRGGDGDGGTAGRRDGTRGTETGTGTGTETETGTAAPEGNRLHPGWVTMIAPRSVATTVCSYCTTAARGSL